MIELSTLIDKEILISIRILTDDHVAKGVHVAEHGAYRIEIETDKRRLVIEGDHDSGPSLS